MTFKINPVPYKLKPRIGAGIQKKSLVSGFLCEKFGTQKPK